jgi:outer membrane biosynthesis protein TonB
MGEVTCQNLELVLSKFKFGPGTFRFPAQTREVTEQDQKIASHWLEAIPQEEFESNAPLPTEDLLEMAAERLGPLDCADIRAIREAAKRVIVVRAMQAVKDCSKTATAAEKKRATKPVAKPAPAPAPAPAAEPTTHVKYAKKPEKLIPFHTTITKPSQPAPGGTKKKPPSAQPTRGIDTTLADIRKEARTPK